MPSMEDVLAERAGGAEMASDEMMAPEEIPAEEALAEAPAGDPTLNAIQVMIKMSDAIKNGEPRLSNKAKMDLSRSVDLLHAVEAELNDLAAQTQMAPGPEPVAAAPAPAPVPEAGGAYNASQENQGRPGAIPVI